MMGDCNREVRAPWLRFLPSVLLAGLALLLSLKGMVATVSAATHPVNQVRAVRAIEQANAARTWTVASGAQSPDKAIQALAFLPGEIWINQGDTIKWAIGTDEPHTISLFADGKFDLPRPRFQTAATTPDNFDYTGTGSCVSSDICVNSGRLQQSSYSITFDVAPGDYVYVCLIHTAMTGTVHLQAAGSAYPHDQPFYLAQAIDQGEQLLDRGAQLEADQQADITSRATTSVVSVATGFAVDTPNHAQDQSVAIQRFLSASPVSQLHTGDSITWTAPDPTTPHTVSFGDKPGDDVNSTAINLAGPGAAVLDAPYPDMERGTTVSSGFLGALPPPDPPLFGTPTTGTTFKVTFNAPGTYQYYCTLHDQLGMVGEIVVSP
jgi:plastocyanin